MLGQITCSSCGWRKVTVVDNSNRNVWNRTLIYDIKPTMLLLERWKRRLKKKPTDKKKTQNKTDVHYKRSIFLYFYLTQTFCVYLSKSAFKTYIHIDFGPCAKTWEIWFLKYFLRKDNQWLIPFLPVYLKSISLKWLWYFSLYSSS